MHVSLYHRGASFGPQVSQKPTLMSRVALRLALWRWSRAQDDMDEAAVNDVLKLLQQATQNAPAWAKAWHNWALFNVAALNNVNAPPDSAAPPGSPGSAEELASTYITSAIRGFFRSIALSQPDAAHPRSPAAARGAGALQDILRLLTLWFNHGTTPEVPRVLREGFGAVRVETWLAVIPQIIARIHTSVQVSLVDSPGR